MHHCKLQPGQWGICRARKNEDGAVVCENYGQISSIALDPIEKKPLKMFHPGSMILSVGGYGCNLRCPFCQNHEISMRRPMEKNGTDFEANSAGNCAVNVRTESEHSRIYYLSPRKLAENALEYRAMGNIGVAFTYNEPLVGWEYVLDTAKLVRESGMINVLVTNGTASLEVLEQLLPYMDAMNIDLKGFREEYYRKLGGDLRTVQEFIVRALEGCHVELTTLIVPGENDSVSEMEEEAAWIASVGERAGKDIPLHVTRFFPRYQMQDREATQVQGVYQLAETAKKYLKHVFVGNC